MTDPREEHHKSNSNPEKSFEAGKKGGKPSTETTGQSSDVLKGSKIVNQSASSDDPSSREDSNRSQQDKS